MIGFPGLLPPLKSFDCEANLLFLVRIVDGVLAPSLSDILLDLFRALQRH